MVFYKVLKTTAVDLDYDGNIRLDYLDHDMSVSLLYGPQFKDVGVQYITVIYDTFYCSVCKSMQNYSRLETFKLHVQINKTLNSLTNIMKYWLKIHC